VLTGVDERRAVTRAEDGTFHAADGREPSTLSPASLASMNLWGFEAAMWDVFSTAMDEAHDASEDKEVLLPELVGRLVARGGPHSRFEVLETSSRCLGVTHPDDLALVRGQLAEEIGRGERPVGAFQR